MQLQEIGVNTEREFEEFDKVLSEQPLELQISVKNKILSANSTLEAKLKKMLRTTLPSVSQILRNKFKTSKEKTPKMIKGNKVGFNNFLEAAEYLDRNLNQFSEPNLWKLYIVIRYSVQKYEKLEQSDLCYFRQLAW